MMHETNHTSTEYHCNRVQSADENINSATLFCQNITKCEEIRITSLQYNDYYGDVLTDQIDKFVYFILHIRL